MSSIQDFLIDIGAFINNILLPFLFALALLFFIVNVARYFILGANDQKQRAQAKQLALYGIAGFVIMVSVWGIVNLFTSSFGIDTEDSLCPDYLDDQGWCDGYSLPQQGWGSGPF